MKVNSVAAMAAAIGRWTVHRFQPIRADRIHIFIQELPQPDAYPKNLSQT